jgi:transketolase
MEGVSHEACSLAGRLSLSRLIVFYDDNDISIDGRVQPWFADDTPQRFEAYGWRVVPHCDGHDADSIEAAIRMAKTQTGRPTLICCKTMIGFGSPNKGGTHEVHGAPLGAAEIADTRRLLEWPFGPFEIPGDVRAGWDARSSGSAAENDWDARFSSPIAPPIPSWLPSSSGACRESCLPTGARASPRCSSSARQRLAVATRKASQNVIEALAPVLPELLGGSADLTGSNLTNWSGSRPANREAAGNYVNYGVREFGMTAIANGIALHGGFIPYTATFLVFSDYARNAIRLAALMKQRQLMVFTHDSIGLGEDGPTHQPIEHAASLRLIPGLDVWRPGDAVETAVAWSAALERNDGPSCFLLSRQNLPALPRTGAQISAIKRGGYAIGAVESAVASVLLIGTGSELSIALAAQAVLKARRYRRLRGLDALYAALRSAASGLPAGSAAAIATGHRHRGRASGSVVEVCGQQGRRDWHRPLWRVGAGGRALRVLRHQRGKRRLRGAPTVGGAVNSGAEVFAGQLGKRRLSSRRMSGARKRKSRQCRLFFARRLRL